MGLTQYMEGNELIFFFFYHKQRVQEADTPVCQTNSCQEWAAEAHVPPEIQVKTMVLEVSIALVCEAFSIIVRFVFFFSDVPNNTDNVTIYCICKSVCVVIATF